MTISGIPKPGWRAFQLLHELAGDERLEATVTEIDRGDRGDRGGAAHCTTELNTIMAGFDIGVATQAHDIAGCCDACRNNSKCSFWSLNPNHVCVEIKRRRKNHCGGRDKRFFPPTTTEKQWNTGVSPCNKDQRKQHGCCPRWQ